MSPAPGGGESPFDPVPIALLRDAPVEFDRRARLLARDGREIEVDGFVAPVRTGAEVLGVVLTFRDASAHRWEERQLRQAHRLEAAGKLAAGAAGEYTTLIAIIRKQNELLLRQFGDYSAAREPLEEIHRAAAAADEITRRLEAFGTRQVWQPETLSVNGLLRRMARLIEAAAGSRIRVALRPSPGAGQVKAVVAQMESAILNLVTHACDVMPQGGQLLIDTARVDLPHAANAEPYVLLAIAYSAVEPEIERLFDPASAGGSGLALAQVHWLAAECGGYVSARSNPNGGSRIELLIPAPGRSGAAGRTRRSARLHSAGGASRIRPSGAAQLLRDRGLQPDRGQRHGGSYRAGRGACRLARCVDRRGRAGGRTLNPPSRIPSLAPGPERGRGNSARTLRNPQPFYPAGAARESLVNHRPARGPGHA